MRMLSRVVRIKDSYNKDEEAYRKTINAKTFKNMSINVKIEMQKGKAKTYKALLRKSGLSKKVKVIHK